MDPIVKEMVQLGPGIQIIENRVGVQRLSEMLNEQEHPDGLISIVYTSSNTKQAHDLLKNTVMRLENAFYLKNYGDNCKYYSLENIQQVGGKGRYSTLRLTHIYGLLQFLESKFQAEVTENLKVELFYQLVDSEYSDDYSGWEETSMVDRTMELCHLLGYHQVIQV